MDHFYYKSPIGILEIGIEKDCLISLKIIDNIQQNCIESDFVKNIKTQLDEYFVGRRKGFDIKILPRGTEFQKKVWNELQKIPYGETRSYSEIAEKTGNKNSSRAVGNACNKNPILLIIPCHRVVAKNGNRSGFAYGQGIKKSLLMLEKNMKED